MPLACQQSIISKLNRLLERVAVISLIMFFTPLLFLQEMGVEGRLRLMMESALTARDRVGVQDFVLLENYTSEAAFIENLRRRFKESLIYVISPYNHCFS